jgi:hypothetical protein
VSNDERYTTKNFKKFICLCPEGYSGDYCEYQRNYNQIEISFHHTLTIPPSLLVHLITVQSNVDPIRTSIMKNIPIDQTSVTLYTSTKFNIAFVEMFNNYYLIILREQTFELATISTDIVPSHRCLSIEELFNKTFANQHLLKRIKYYQIPCQKRMNLVCFYDDIHLCMCNLQQQTNCFEFNHNMTYDCHGYNLCEHQGQCFLDNTRCATSSLCICRDCYYGSRCQFSTEGSTLSLDTIIGYHIRPNVGINRQTTVIKVSVAFNIIIFSFGFFSSLLSFSVFRVKKTRDVGCGFYLWASSVTSMIVLFILVVKFWLLLTSQIGSIKNRSLIYVYCISLDFLLRTLLSASDWLSACVAIERTVNVTIGVSFNKTKSKQIAKRMIIVVFILTGCTFIHDPLHRHLIDDKEEQRTWCITEYTPFAQTYDWTINIFHFLSPFLVNIISAFIIIISTFQVRSNVQNKNTIIQQLNKQFRQHRHLLISPLILVILAIPRLIISLSSKCMKSARNPWFYLIGYFISYIPSTLTFFVFVLPSDVYKAEFMRWTRRFQRQ